MGPLLDPPGSAEPSSAGCNKGIKGWLFQLRADQDHTVTRCSAGYKRATSLPICVLLKYGTASIALVNGGGSFAGHQTALPIRREGHTASLNSQTFRSDRRFVRPLNPSSQQWLDRERRGGLQQPDHQTRLRL